MSSHKTQRQRLFTAVDQRPVWQEFLARPVVWLAGEK